MFDYDENEQEMARLCRGKSRKDIDEIIAERKKEKWENQF